jgi:hypothetical protein
MLNPSSTLNDSRTAENISINREMLDDVYQEGLPLGVPQSSMKAEMGWLWAHVGRWVLAISAASTPMTYVDPRIELRQSGASSIVWSMRRRHGQAISLREARQLALSILDETEQRLKEERTRESRFLLSYWDETEDNTP